MNINNHIIDKIKNKALQSTCRYKVGAIGFTVKGNYIGHTMNTHRFLRKGGGNHAELTLMKKYGQRIKTIIICRVGKDLLPIDPCPMCQKIADQLGIKIVTVK